MNSLFRFLMCVMICFSIHLVARSQSISENFNHSYYQPTSPNAAILGRFGDIPIGHYTGTADVSIPIYNIKESGLEVPIMLQYHGSGIRVEDQASDVGLGWSMEPGGAIIQIVNGSPDESEALVGGPYYDFLKSRRSYPSYRQHYSRGNIGTLMYPCKSLADVDSLDSDAMRVRIQEEGDGQPDIYQFSFPGGFSGRFYKNRETNKFEIMDKKNEITFTYFDNNQTWTARLLNGTVYTFAAMEKSNVNGVYATQYTSRTWKLTNILFPNNKNIRFTYRNGYNEWFYYNESYHSNYLLVSSFDYTSPVRGVTYSLTKILDSIITSDVNIRFKMEDRHDMFGDNSITDDGNKTVKRVKSIEIKDKFTGRKIKNIDFGYDYFAYDNTIGGNYAVTSSYSPKWSLVDSAAILGKRLKLLSLKETEYDFSGKPSEIPAYQFEYDESVTMPLKTSYARDHWGYYNGKNNSKLLPDLSISHYASMLIPSAVVSAVNGANREPDSTKTGVYLLKKIKYPTGGYTTFDYQTHHFNYYPNFGGGMRISDIKNYASSGVVSTHKRVKYGDSRLKSSIQYIYKKMMNFKVQVGDPDFGAYNAASGEVYYVSSDSAIPSGSGAIIGYSTVTEEDLNPSGVKNGRTVYTYLNKPADSEMINLPSIEEPDNGTLLKSQIYNNSNNLLSETKYNYSYLSTDSTFGVKITENHVYQVACHPVTGSFFFNPENEYTYSFYPMWSKWSVLSSKETKNYEGVNEMLTKEDYTYNSKGQRIEVASFNSRAQPVKVNYLYPLDAVSSTATMLRDANLFDHLLEQKTNVNSVEVSKTNLNYHMDGPQIVQTDIVKTNAGSSYTEVEFEEYGPHKSLRQYKQKGLTNSLIWDDSYKNVIAEVKNATSANVAYTGFEWNDSGTWSYNPIGIDTSVILSGKGSYKLLSSYTISRSGLDYNKTYIISYWTDKSSEYAITGTTVSRLLGTSGIWKNYEHEVTDIGSISISDVSGSTRIDDLRLFPKGAQMVTYSSRPGAGMTGQADAKNQSLTYEYDGLKLQYVKDQWGNIVKTYKYHYQQ